MPHPSDATLKSITMDSEGLESWDYCLSHFRKRGLVWQPGNITYFMRQIFSDVTFGGNRVLDIGGGAGLASYYAACMGAESVLCLEPGASGSNACATGVPFITIIVNYESGILLTNSYEWTRSYNHMNDYRDWETDRKSVG